MSMLSSAELQRYQRHFVLRGFGIESQNKLKKSKVLVVGAGGLGCPVLLYLTAAGVGTIGIADNDVVSVSNLQRQVIYTNGDIGQLKAEVAASRLRLMNPHVVVRAFTQQVDAQNVLALIAEYDVVVDATDNFPARYLLNDACVLSDKTLVYGSVLEFEGHVSVFNFKSNGTYGANYRDLFATPPVAESVPNCEQAGVLGIVPGIIGCYQANEVLKILTQSGKVLTNQLLIIDALDLQQSIVSIRPRGTRDQIKTLIDYEDFCGINPKKNKSLGTNTISMKEVTVQELKKMKESGEDFQLIDVREPYEYDICHLNGELIPMSEIPSNVEKISRDKKVVLHCRSGKRSGDMLLWLEKNYNLNNLYNLKGGILAWAKEIDPEMPTY